MTENVGGRRLDFNGNPIPNAATPTGAIANASCGSLDSNVAPANTPHTRIQLFAPNSATPIIDQVSPVRRIGTSSFIFPVYDRGGPFTVTWTIPDNAVPGIYTVTSTVIDRKKTTATGTTASGSPCAQQTPQVSTVQFEYRPWSQKFKDVLGNGDVSFNLSPPEFQATLRTISGPITDGSTTMHAFQVPNPASFTVPADPAGCASDPASCLPAGAQECAPGQAGCTPTVVTINWSSDTQTVYGIFDLTSRAFVAVVKIGNTNASTLFSLGTENDAVFRDLLLQLANQAAAQGISLMDLLATKVQVRLNNGPSSTNIEVSLLEGLQMYEQTPGANTGVSIIAPITASIGLQAHSYSFAGVDNPDGIASAQAGCSTVGSNGRCSGEPSSPAHVRSVGRYAGKSGFGYNALKSDLLPDLPPLFPLPPLPALPPVPGAPIQPSTALFLVNLLGPGLAPPTKFFNIYGKYTAGAHRTTVGISTDPNEPHGLPVWVHPLGGFTPPADPNALVNNPLALAAFALGLLNTPTFNDRAIDFLGTASFTARETCTADNPTATPPVVGTCSGSGSMTGLGVGIYSSSQLPVGFRNIPIWDANPAAADLMAQLNAAIADARAQGTAQVAAILADPQVQAVLAQIYGQLGTLPPVEVPEV